MRKLKLFFSFSIVVLITSCSSGGSDGNGGGNDPGTQINFADYFPVELPAQTSSCTSTYEVTSGPNIGQISTSVIDGSTETINYTAGDLTGSVITNEEGGNIQTLVILNDGSNVKYLRYADQLVSTDCNLSAHPSAWSFGVITDGMIKDIITFSAINRNNTSVCQSTPTSTDPGNRALYRIVDVSIQGALYEDALVEYWLDIDSPFAMLQYNGDFGIPIPTSAETEGGSVTDISIYGFDEGVIASLGVSASTGEVLDIKERTSRVCN